MRALDEGRAAVLVLVQRSDAKFFKPNEVTDPDFAENLREAARMGVEVHAYNSDVNLSSVTIKQKIEVLR